MLRIFAPLLGQTSYTDFLWAWHVINTRSVYMEQAKNCQVRRTPEDPDNFALAPFLDLLNHSDTAQVRSTTSFTLHLFSFKKNC